MRSTPFFRSARKSARLILHSTRTERPPSQKPMASGISPDPFTSSVTTMGQRYVFVSHAAAAVTRSSCVIGGSPGPANDGRSYPSRRRRTIRKGSAPCVALKPPRNARIRLASPPRLVGARSRRPPPASVPHCDCRHAVWCEWLSSEDARRAVSSCRLQRFNLILHRSSHSFDAGILLRHEGGEGAYGVEV